MKTDCKSIRFFFAGSLVATLALLAMVPFNMGGCGSSNLPDVTSVFPSSITGNRNAGFINAGIKGGQAFAINQRQEKAIGESVSLAATNRYGVISNEQLARYVVLIGQTLASRTERADQPWVFGVLDTDTVNALSGPGGYVWVTRGAIDRMQDESELAGVLAHEIGHVVKQHGIQAARAAGLGDAFLTAVNTASAQAAAFGKFSDGVVDIVLNKGFSRAQEFEADAEGVKLVASAGYDPNGLLHFLQRIQTTQQSSGQQFFSTHPGMGERISRIQNQISSAGTGGKGATLKDRFNFNTGKTAQPAAF